MLQLLVYADSLSWGIIPNTRRRLNFVERWPGAMEDQLIRAGRSVRVWNVNEGRSISKFRAFRKFADALAVSPDRKLFAAGSRDGVVRVWDSASGREVKEYEWGVGGVQELAFSPDGSTAAAAGISAVVVWDLD